MTPGRTWETACGSTGRDYHQQNGLPSGNVGVGTDNPSQKLDVAGTINAQGFLLNGQSFTGSGTPQSPLRRGRHSPKTLTLDTAPGKNRTAGGFPDHDGNGVLDTIAFDFSGFQSVGSNITWANAFSLNAQNGVIKFPTRIEAPQLKSVLNVISRGRSGCQRDRGSRSGLPGDPVRGG